MSRPDASATDELLQRHEARVYRFGLRLCSNEDDASEVLQETLLAAFKHLPTFRGDARVSPWLFQVARSSCIKQRRRREGEPSVHEPVEAPEVQRLSADEPRGDSTAHAREVGQLMQAAINTLQADHREALVLRDVEGLSAEEAAEVGALKRRLHRARLALKQQLAAVLDERDDALSCPALAQELTAYAASEIDQAACEHIEAHLAKCARCAKACDALKRTVSMCRALPGGDVPAPVKAAVRQALRRSATG